MLLYNQLPDRDEASAMTRVFTGEEVALLLSLLPPRDSWFSFDADSVCRTQSRSLTSESDPELFHLLDTGLARVGLVISKPMVHPRLYRQGDFMDWHSDYDHLPNLDLHLYECTLVLFNTSDSVTRFKHGSSSMITSYSSNPGDVLVVRRHGISHSVSEITNGGERLMIKITCSRLSIDSLV